MASAAVVRAPLCISDLRRTRGGGVSLGGLLEVARLGGTFLPLGDYCA